MVGIISSDDFHYWGEKLLALLIATSKTSTGLDNEQQVQNYSRTVEIYYLAPPWWGFVLILSCYESKCNLRLPGEILACAKSPHREKGSLGWDKFDGSMICYCESMRLKSIMTEWMMFVGGLVASTPSKIQTDRILIPRRRAASGMIPFPFTYYFLSTWICLHVDS